MIRWLVASLLIACSNPAASSGRSNPTTTASGADAGPSEQTDATTVAATADAEPADAALPKRVSEAELYQVIACGDSQCLLKLPVTDRVAKVLADDDEIHGKLIVLEGLRAAPSLVKLPWIRHLKLDGGPTPDPELAADAMEAIASLDQLRSLELGNLPVSDISSIPRRGLWKISLAHMPIEDLSALSKLDDTVGSKISLRALPATKMKPLGQLRIDSLALYEMAELDFSGIDRDWKIDKLYIGESNMEVLPPTLAGLKRLRWLVANNNLRLHDISVAAKLPALSDIQFENTAVADSDLAGLKRAKKLARIWLRCTNVRSVMALTKIKSLKSVTYGPGQLPLAEQRAFRKRRPDIHLGNFGDYPGCPR